MAACGFPPTHRRSLHVAVADRALLDANGDDEQLYEAAACGDAVRVAALRNAGARADGYRDWNGATALLVASRDGHTAAVLALLRPALQLQPAASTAAVSRFGSTALILSAQAGHVDVVRALLLAGADVSYARSRDGATALARALANGHTAVAHELRTAGGCFLTGSRAPPARSKIRSTAAATRAAAAAFAQGRGYEQARRCAECAVRFGGRFSPFLRRHHCRLCRRSFCAACSAARVEGPAGRVRACAHCADAAGSAVSMAPVAERMIIPPPPAPLSPSLQKPLPPQAAGKQRRDFASQCCTEGDACSPGGCNALATVARKPDDCLAAVEVEIEMEMVGGERVAKCRCATTARGSQSTDACVY